MGYQRTKGRRDNGYMVSRMPRTLSRHDIRIQAGYNAMETVTA
jgi:hypothetical protein